MKTLSPLTEKQKDVLDFLVSYQEEKGYPPTLKEFSENLKLSESAIIGRLDAIEKKGYIEREHNTSRGIKILVYHKNISFPQLIP